MSFCWSRLFFRSGGSDPAAGFTLFELLIAMALTAIMASVMFKTWELVTRSGAEAQRIVAQREGERVVFGIMDNDMAGILPAGEDIASLPPLSRNAIEPDDEYYAALGEKKQELKRKGETMLLSFACGSSLNPDGASLGFPVCVEYLLRRDSGQEQSLVRRERDYCGVSGEFPWSEAILMEGLLNAGIELVLKDGSRLSQWKESDLSAQPVAVRFYWQKTPGGEEEFIFPLFDRRLEIGWEKQE